jgi:hypothetical protein
MGRKAVAKRATRDARRDFDDLVQRLWEQLEFLRTSAKAYDEGSEGEARRLAATLRLLFFRSQKSPGLLEQVDVARRLLMLNTAEPINPRNLAPTMGLVMLQMSGLPRVWLTP